MTPSATATDGGEGLWRRIAHATEAPGPGGLDPAACDRFIALASPALAEHLLGPGLVGPERLAQSRLNNRFRLAAQYEALSRIAESGVHVVAIKGFALAHMLYGEPATRTVGDLDILVRAGERDRLIACLSDWGFVFVPLPRPPWGFISEASYAPFVSPDGECNLDLHIHPDCYPAYRSLTTERVFDAAETVTADRLSVLVPCPEHAFLLCATNTAKDKFGPFAARKIADAMILTRSRALDWPKMAAIAAEGGFSLPYLAFLHLLRDLGLGADSLPDEAISPLPASRSGEYARMLSDVRAIWPGEAGLAATFRRELLLSTEPAVGLRNGWTRLRGLFAPASGVPEVAGS